MMAVLTAAGAAAGLYFVGHDEMGIARHAIVADSFVSAAGLAIICAIATIAKRPK
jgi:hypothetical protein